MSRAIVLSRTQLVFIKASRCTLEGLDEFGRHMLVLIAGGRLHDYDVIGDHTSDLWKQQILGTENRHVTYQASMIARLAIYMSTR